MDIHPIALKIGGVCPGGRQSDRVVGGPSGLIRLGTVLRVVAQSRQDWKVAAVSNWRGSRRPLSHARGAVFVGQLSCWIFYGTC